MHALFVRSLSQLASRPDKFRLEQENELRLVMAGKEGLERDNQAVPSVKNLTISTVAGGCLIALVLSACLARFSSRIGSSPFAMPRSFTTRFTCGFKKIGLPGDGRYG